MPYCNIPGLYFLKRIMYVLEHLSLVHFIDVVSLRKVISLASAFVAQEYGIIFACVLCLNHMASSSTTMENFGLQLINFILFTK